MSQSHHRFFAIRRFPTYSFWMVFFFIFLFLPACNPMYPPPPIPHIKAGTVFYSYSINRGINALAWSPNGTRIAVAQDGPGATVQVWDAFTGKNRFSYQGHTFSAFTVAWSPGGRRIASGGENAQVWDATTGRLLLTYHGHVDSPESRESAQVTSLAWSPDGKFIVSACIVDYTVQMWDSTTGKTLWKRPLKQASSVAWSSDGQWIAAAGDGVIKIFAASTGSVMGVDSGHSGFVRSVSWFPDNKHLASVGDDRTLQVWDAVTEKTNITYPIQTTFSALHVAISPDGKYLAYGTADGIVQVSASMTMQKLISHGGNQFQGVQALAWSPDGKKIVSEATSVSSGNTLVDVWQAISS